MRFFLILYLLIFLNNTIFRAPQKKLIVVNIEKTLAILLQEEDTDKNKRITVDDMGDKHFTLMDKDSKKYGIVGTYQLSNLLQELARARDSGKKLLEISYQQIDELPVDRISRLISTYYWDGLTRKMDKQGLMQILIDPKMKSAPNLYVPFDDQKAWKYYTSIADELGNLNVIKLPQKISYEYVKSLDTKPGILVLSAKTDNSYNPRPFVVPGGRFNEMYGWDSYFINIGLLLDSRVQMARSMVDNHLYQVNHYGKILNANRTYYLTRSQPPFLTSMVREVYDLLEKNPENKNWLQKALQACIKEYKTVWMSKPHITSTGLSRYYDIGQGMPPETEPDHFDEILLPFAEKAGLTLGIYKKKYMNGEINEPELTEFFIHDRSMRESGHDTSNRLIGVCADLNTVDLNALLYKYEMDIAELINTEFDDNFALENGTSEKSQTWFNLAEKRKTRMNELMWDETSAQYYDYNYKQGKKTYFQSITNLFPLWANMVSNEQAQKIFEQALPIYIAPGGLVSTSLKSRGDVNKKRPQRQWDYPNGWAPHQILIWKGLNNYGFDEKAQTLAYRWMYMITRNAVDYNGTIPEKYDVVSRSHKVFAEYGNVGTDFQYITREGFGWMNASFQIGKKYLSEELLDDLNRLIPPEWIF